jgi:hypothetical protein
VNILICCVVAILLGISSSLRMPEARADQRYFRVSDSISMTTFSRPSGMDATNQTDFSPDGRYITVVTSRGLLDKNEVESTIWLLKTETLVRFVEGHDDSPEGEAAPRPVATIAAVPDIAIFETYAPVISDLKWSPDSGRLYFLGMDSHEERRLYELDIRSGRLRSLTPLGWGVRQYTLSGSMVAYTANRTKDAHPDVPWDATEAINKDAGAVTGLGLEAILYPARGQGSGSGRYVPDLWVGAYGHFRHVSDSDGAGPALDVEHYSNALALSPDGKNVVRLLPISHVDGSWHVYDPKPGFESWRINSHDAYLTSPFYRSRLREYMLIDTVTGKQEPLIQGPHGSSLAEEDATTAIWSPDGRRLLLGNVGLPLNGVGPEERKRRERTCALASVDLPSLDAHCIAFTRDASAVIPADNPHPLRLQSASFEGDNNSVVLSFAWHGRWGRTERYQFNDKQWHLTDTAPGDAITGEPLEDASKGGAGRVPPIRLIIKQDLNVSPTLWASFHGKSKLLWNPNPQLGAMKLGKASVYHWRDKDSHVWEGILVLPADYTPGKRYPLVIQTHGYLPAVFITDGVYPTAMAARPLSSAGFVVLQTDNRPDHFVSFQESSDAIDGWESAISQLDTAGVIDKTRVGIIGFSRTCWYVEEALIQHPHLFSAATIADGVDFSYMTYHLFGEGRPAMAKEYETVIGATPVGAGLDSWIRGAPGFHLDQVETPLRVEAIGPVSVLMEWEIYSSLRAQKKPVDMIYLPTDQHVLQKPLDRLASQQGNVDWFSFWLQSHEDPEPAKASQYARWRAMRDRQN